MTNHDDLIIAFDNLDLNNKRKKLNNELVIMGEYINFIKEKMHYNGISDNLEINNYDLFLDSHLKEEEILTVLYDDIYKIEREIITIAHIIATKN